MTRWLSLPFACLLLAFVTTGNAQDQFQSQLLEHYFVNDGQVIINSWAHPLYDHYISETEVSIFSGFVLVTLYYSGNFEDFNCTYRINIDSFGNFTGLAVIEEGNIWTSSFYLCDEFKDQLSELYETDFRTKEKVETYIGKGIRYFSCKDYCLLGLNYYWVKDGYYSEY